MGEHWTLRAWTIINTGMYKPTPLIQADFISDEGKPIRVFIEPIEILSKFGSDKDTESLSVIFNALEAAKGEGGGVMVTRSCWDEERDRLNELYGCDESCRIMYAYAAHFDGYTGGGYVLADGAVSKSKCDTCYFNTHDDEFVMNCFNTVCSNGSYKDYQPHPGYHGFEGPKEGMNELNFCGLHNCPCSNCGLPPQQEPCMFLCTKEEGEKMHAKEDTQ